MKYATCRKYRVSGMSFSGEIPRITTTRYYLAIVIVDIFPDNIISSLSLTISCRRSLYNLKANSKYICHVL